MPELEKRKTGGLTALGVLSVVLGGLWIIASAWGLLQPQVHDALVKLHKLPQLLTGLGLAGAYVDAAINLLLAGVLFVAGIGLLKLRRWGAIVATWYAVCRIVLSVLATVLAFIGPTAQGTRLDVQDNFIPIAIAEVIGGFVLSTLFAVILLCLLSRGTYKDKLS